MIYTYLPHAVTQEGKIWRRLLLVILLVVQLLVAFTPKPAGALSLTSLLGVDDLAHKTLNQINQVINNTQGGLHDELSALSSQVSGIINQLEGTYKDLLNVSLNGLDVTVQQFATTLANELDDINTKINQDINNAQQALQTVIRDARNQIGATMSQFEDSANNIIVLTTQSTVFVLDRAAWNVIGVAAVIILLIGLLAIPLLIILEKGWPKGIGGLIAGVLVVAFVAVGALLAFVPNAKAQALKALSKGNEVPTIVAAPQIFDTVPNPVYLGQTNEITINGVHLIVDGQQPVVTINGVNAAIRGSGANQITVAAPRSGQSQTVQLMLSYNNGQQTVGVPIQLIVPTQTPSPALIFISNYYVSPSNPVAGSTIVNAYVTVANRGGLVSQQFNIVWSPDSNIVLNIHVPALNPNASQQFTSGPYTYPHAGSYSTQITSGSNQMGSTALLNYAVTVQAPTATPTRTPGPPITISSGLVDTSSQFGVLCDMRHDFEVDVFIPIGYQWDNGSRSLSTTGSRSAGANVYGVGDPWVDGQTLKQMVHVGLGTQVGGCGSMYIIVNGHAIPK
jgi:ElaB/YqjD/DUF883 family membrane-anchored ribosome-binding protein